MGKREKVIVGAILLTALIMRLVAINQSLWLDEAIGAIAVRDYSLPNLISHFIKYDNHTPLFYLFLKYETDIFGYSELSLRSLSVGFGVATIYITYRITKIIGKSRYFSILTLLLLTTSQFHIYYSQEARMYSMATFFAVLSVFYFIRLVSSQKIINWMMFSASVTLMLFTDYAPVFLIPVFWLYAALNIKDKKWRTNFIICHIPLGILGLIWLPVIQAQTSNYREILKVWPAWRKVAGGATIKQALLVWMKFVLGRISYPNKLYYYVLVGLASIPFIISYIKLIFSRKNKYINLVIYWLLLPLLIGYIVSIWFPAFIYFRFLYVLPAFYILTAWSIDTFTILPIKRFLSLLLIGINLFGWLTYIVDERQQREQWRQAVEFVENKTKNDEIALFEFPEPFAPYRWYATGRITAAGVTDSVSATRDETLKIINNTLKDREGVYYFEYLHDLSDPGEIVKEYLAANNFTAKEVYNFIGVGQIYYFSKQ